MFDVASLLNTERYSSGAKGACLGKHGEKEALCLQSGQAAHRGAAVLRDGRTGLSTYRFYKKRNEVGDGTLRKERGIGENLRSTT